MQKDKFKINKPDFKGNVVLEHGIITAEKKPPSPPPKQETKQPKK